MVKVIDYSERRRGEKDFFYVLIVQGGVEAVRSMVTGRLYFTTKTATVATTFEQDVCEELVGKTFPGSIQKEACEPYEYMVEETGEIISITTRNVYADDTIDLVKDNVVDEKMIVT